MNGVFAFYDLFINVALLYKNGIIRFRDDIVKFKYEFIKWINYQLQ